MNKRALVVDQLYNLAAGFLYALSICYFARGSDFAPGGISGLALIVNYLWHLPVGITTLVFNLPLVALSIRFVGRAFLAKSLVSMVWCTVFQDVVFARVGCYTGDPLVAALFAGVTWGFALALLYMRGSSSGGTDFLTMSIKVLRPHLSIGAVTGGIDLVVILLGWPVFGTVDSVLYGLVTTVITSLVIDKVMYGSSSSKMLTIITTKGQSARAAPPCSRPLAPTPTPSGRCSSASAPGPRSTASAPPPTASTPAAWSWSRRRAKCTARALLTPVRPLLFYNTRRLFSMNFGSALEQVHRRAPLVDCITNFVTVNDCANILLAVGGSPTMASDIREVQETAAAASALLCNLGAIDKVESMILGGQAANRAGKPVVFDPVGAGNTSLRRAESARLLDAVQFAVIRGNASEIRALAQRRAAGSGVDVSDADQITEKTLPRTVASARALAVQTGAVVAVSGPIDVLTDGRETILLHNGCATMSRVTGSGCMLTALMGAFCGAMPGQPFAAACAAAATMGVAGELAEARRLAHGTGNATFRTDLIDAVFNLTPAQLDASVHWESYSK